MATKKVILNGQTIIDLSDTTATTETVAEGRKFYDAHGDSAYGMANFNETSGVNGKENYQPHGTLNITQNGYYNVYEYENVEVNVDESSGSNSIENGWMVTNNNNMTINEYYHTTDGNALNGYSLSIDGFESGSYLSDVFYTHGDTNGAVSLGEKVKEYVINLTLYNNGDPTKNTSYVPHIEEETYGLWLGTYNPQLNQYDNRLFYAPFTLEIYNKEDELIPIENLNQSYSNKSFQLNTVEIIKHTYESADQFIIDNNIDVPYDEGSSESNKMNRDRIIHSIITNLPASITMIYKEYSRTRT